MFSSSIWNRVQFPEKYQLTRIFVNTSAMVVGCGVVSLCVSSITNLLVG